MVHHKDMFHEKKVFECPQCSVKGSVAEQHKNIKGNTRPKKLYGTMECLLVISIIKIKVCWYFCDLKNKTKNKYFPTVKQCNAMPRSPQVG